MENIEIIENLDEVKAQLEEIQIKLEILSSRLQGGWEVTEFGATKKVMNPNTKEVTTYTIGRNDKRGFYNSYYSHCNNYAIRYNDEIRRGYSLNQEHLDQINELYLEKKALMRRLTPRVKKN